MKKVRILHLLSSNSYSGAENVVCTIIENETSDYETYYCSPNGAISDILNKKKIKYIPLNKLTSKELKKVLVDYKIDILHAHDFKASFIAGTTKFDGKIISHIHCNPNFIKYWNPYSILYSIISKRFNHIIFVSTEATKNTIFLNKIKDKYSVIQNVVNPYGVKQKSKEIETKKYDIVFVGRLIDLKQPKLVINITNELKKVKKNIKTCIIGNGELYEECEQLISELNLQNQVDLLGFKENPFPYVKNSKIAIMPSKFEGLPMSAIECMILNVPLLNSGAGGLKELFKKNEEFICKDEREYVNKITELLKDNKAYDKYKNACPDIIKDFIDIKAYISKINEIYKKGD